MHLLLPQHTRGEHRPRDADTRVPLLETLVRGIKLVLFSSLLGQPEIKAMPAVPDLYITPWKKTLVWVPWDLLVSQSPAHTRHQPHPNFGTSVTQSMWWALGKAGLTESMNKTIGTTHRPEGFLIPGLNFPEKQRTIPCIMY